MVEARGRQENKGVAGGTLISLLLDLTADRVADSEAPTTILLRKIVALPRCAGSKI